MKKNIAVVGCGHWGKNLVRNFAELGALAAVCDPNIELAQYYAEQYKVNKLSFSEIINDASIEGVVLAVPAPLHASMACEAARAGKHIYVEKPLALNQVDAEKMIAAASEYKVKLMVGHLLQYHPVFVALRKLVECDELGVIQYIYSNRLSFGKVRSEEDVIWSFAPHDISMILALVRQEPLLVRTESTNILQADIADTATLHIEFESGLKSHIAISWLHPYKEQKLVVVGTKGMAVFDDNRAWDEKLAFYGHTTERANGVPVLRKSEVTYIKVTESEPLRNECQHFTDVVNSDLAPLTNGHEGMSVLNVLSAASASQKMNKSCRVGQNVEC